jgi:tetratricopeptide (TPR) repeat protein
LVRAAPPRPPRLARAAHHRAGIAYHNLAVELEFLGRRAESLEWYRKALRLAREHLGEDEGVTQMFRCSLDEARHALPRKASPQRRPQSARAPRPARPRTRRA